jgi:ABC-type glutathione transport system ATPase component
MKICCAKCEEEAIHVTRCPSCGNGQFCDQCLDKHMAVNPSHDTHSKKMKWIWGTIGKMAEKLRATYFEHDEQTKWFGHCVENLANGYVTSITQTQRFSRLVRQSTEQYGHQQQFPSIVAFVGETGAGKSSISKSIFWLEKCVVI